MHVFDRSCPFRLAVCLQISLTDSEGDGWVGGVPGYYNLWTLAEVGSESVKTRGTLADNHDSATIKECLPDGDFIFNTTANQAFADDMGWGICNQYGVAGKCSSVIPK